MMGKRPLESQESLYVKRQKLESFPEPVVEPVTSARQLQLLLTFQQDSSGQLRNGVRSFKAFLDSILYAEDKSTTVTAQAILREFLEAEVPKHGQDEETPMLQNLMLAWSFAAQANNDSLVSSLSAVLALLLKTISTLIDFRDLGIRLCKTLLQQTQLKLLSRSLASPKQKEYIIAPSLRLLTEVTTFDGGSLAKKVFAAKVFTFDGKILARNLSLWKAAANAEEEKRKPSVRTNAVRYLLAHLRHQSSLAKSEILRYGNVIRSLFEHVQHDPTDVLKSILDVVKQSILADDSIQRSIKGHIVNDHNLSSLASLYRREGAAAGSDEPPQQLVHEFLLYVCAEPRAGILRPFAGWYPPGAVRTADDIAVDDDLDGQRYDKYKEKIPVRNTILASFAQHLRPTVSLLDSELLLETFRAAPELTADYFIKKSGFTFDPKLTATWIGYASFLFSTVQLPVPKFFGLEENYGSVPPPTSVVLGNILPLPLSQAVLTRCLNQKADLITFFTVRILCQAFQKLQTVLDLYDDAGGPEDPLWTKGSRTLRAEFAQRVPKLRDVVATFKKTALENHIQREAVLRLIELYYREGLAIDDKFDISVPLAEELIHFESSRQEYLPGKDINGSHADKNEAPSADSTTRLRVLELDHMLRIAQQSPDMRWLHKPETLPHSPLVMLLKLVSTLSVERVSDGMRSPLLQFFTEDYNCLQNETGIHAVYALLASLNGRSTVKSEEADWKAEDSVFHFLDDALIRSTRKLAKYEDDRDKACAEQKATAPVSHLSMTLIEQLPFCKENMVSVATWLKRFFAACIEIGEDAAVIQELTRQVDVHVKATGHKARKIKIDTAGVRSNLAFYTTLDAKSTTSGEQPPATAKENGPPVDSSRYLPPPEDTALTALHHSTTKPLSDVLSYLPSLLVHMSSAYPEVRQRALASIGQIYNRLTNTPTDKNNPDAQPTELLLLCLTCTLTAEVPDISTTRPPHILSVYAVLAARVLADPLHPLYEAINKYHLSRGPRWEVARLASYWTHKILYTQAAPFDPTRKGQARHDDASPGDEYSRLPGKEDPAVRADISTPAAFLLSLVYESLRTPTDVDALHARGTLEPLLGMAANPACPDRTIAALLRILWRIAGIEDGPAGLVKKGVLGWLEGRKMAASATGTRKGRGQRVSAEDAELIGERGIEQLIERLRIASAVDSSDEEMHDED